MKRAAVLPGLRADGTGRGRLVPAVLVAGSFAPDVTYYAASFLSGAMEFGDVTHSWPGVLTVDGLVACACVACCSRGEPAGPCCALAARGRFRALAARAGRPRHGCGRPPHAWCAWYRSGAEGDVRRHSAVWSDRFKHIPTVGRALRRPPREIRGSPAQRYRRSRASDRGHLTLARCTLPPQRRRAPTPRPEETRWLVLRPAPRADPSGVDGRRRGVRARWPQAVRDRAGPPW
ncbi:zinc dependent phospholipase C family protein [Streptomyces sp. DHE17-7]|uniref:zinc dependent phospholipase C family protein n=1 Tax=Streptomyces sp. DHE17-7 TaxID=2759949 RepID=UPI003FA6BED5